MSTAGNQSLYHNISNAGGGGQQQQSQMVNLQQQQIRSHSVDSNLTSLSGDTDLTTASNQISNDGIDNAIRIRGVSGVNAGLPGYSGSGAATNASFGGSTAAGGQLDATSAGEQRRARRYSQRGGGNTMNASFGGGPSSYGTSALTGTGQVPVCTLCDAASSDFSCRACGGLTFCEKCALSLHTNKFLGSHTLQNILDPNDSVLGSDLAIRRATIDAERAAREIYSDEARQGRLDEEEEQLKQQLRLATAAGQDRAREDADNRKLEERLAAAAGPKYDMKALAADKSVLQARSKELRSCIEILKRLGLRLAEEQASCIDATRTAGEAVKKKFDLLRGLINQKEQQFLQVVQHAGKTRHDAGAAQRTAIAAAVAETSAFVDNLELQLQRLEGNYSMFDECRAGLLEDTKGKISAVDDHIHRFEGVVQEVRDIPLGVVVPVDGIVTALQMLQPPERTIGSAEVAIMNASEALLPVPANRFESALGVRHFRSGSDVGSGSGRTDSPMRQQMQYQQQFDTSTGSYNSRGGSNVGSAHFAIHEVPYRNTNSPMRVNGNAGVANSRSGSSQMMMNAPRSGTPLQNQNQSNSRQGTPRGRTTTTQSPMRFGSASRQRYDAPPQTQQQQSGFGRSSTGSNTGQQQQSRIPPEVRELRKHLQGGSGGGVGGRPNSPLRLPGAAPSSYQGGVRTGSPRTSSSYNSYQLPSRSSPYRR